MSTSFYFIRFSDLGPSALAAYRLILSALVTTPLFFWGYKKHRHDFKLSSIWKCAAPGLFLSFHFISWNMGSRLTLGSNATLMVNLVPLVLPISLYFLAREKITRSELYGTLIALLGVLVIGVGDFHLAPEQLKGDLICLGSMVVLSVYIALVRNSASLFPNIWLFTVPVWFFAAISSTLFGWATGELTQKLNPHDYYALFGLILVPTILGHGSSIIALSKVRGQLMSLFNVGQMIPASILAWLAFREKPHLSTYIAAVLVVIGVVVALRYRPRVEPSKS